MKYIAKANTWFDEGTEVRLIDRYSEEFGLFIGMKDGKEDEEVCRFDEFEEVVK